MLMRRYLPHTPLFQPHGARAPHATRNSKIWPIARRWSIWNICWASRGLATTQLTPSGKARFGNELVDVIADGEVVGRGAEVVVVAVHGNRVVVRSARRPSVASRAKID